MDNPLGGAYFKMRKYHFASTINNKEFPLLYALVLDISIKMIAIKFLTEQIFKHEKNSLLKKEELPISYLKISFKLFYSRKKVCGMLEELDLVVLNRIQIAKMPVRYIPCKIISEFTYRRTV